MKLSCSELLCAIQILWYFNSIRQFCTLRSLCFTRGGEQIFGSCYYCVKLRNWYEGNWNKGVEKLPQIRYYPSMYCLEKHMYETGCKGLLRLFIRYTSLSKINHILNADAILEHWSFHNIGTNKVTTLGTFNNSAK